jgi:hypothetical protein
MSGIDYAFPAIDAKVSKDLSAGQDLNAKIQEIQSNISTTERNNFLQNINAADGQSSNTLTYSMMLSRNKSISDISKDMIADNQQLKNGPKDTYARQGEINEWQAQNKLDTLFFLQLTFLYFSVIVFLFFLRRTGIVPGATVMIVISVLTIILIGTLWNRSTYTAFSRDKRYWNRRFIGLGDAGISAETKCQDSSGNS